MKLESDAVMNLIRGFRSSVYRWALVVDNLEAAVKGKCLGLLVLSFHYRDSR